jgi:rhamnosyltransferase
VTFDKQNIVDAYIGYMLSEIKKNVDYLVVVCNETSVVKGLEYLTDYADKVFFRENTGYDAGAFKAALCDLAGWDVIHKYDELLLINDSFFGPFIPLKSILDKMEDKNVDFWGLTVHAEANSDTLGYIPRHVQSYFIAVRHRMLHSEIFMDYWNKMPCFKSFNEVICGHELKFTKYFSDRGYTYAGLADGRCNDSENVKNNYNQYANISYEMIRKRNFPFLKKQQLAYNTLFQQTQENYMKALEYIEKNTDYDVNMIWENIIRTLDINDLQRNLHLLYILRKQETDETEEYNAVILINVSNISAVEMVLEYISPVRSQAKIIINPLNTVLADCYAGCGYTVLDKDSSGESVLHTLMKYEYVCLLHDEDISSDRQPSYIGKAHFFNVWGNLLGENGNFKEILRTFKNNKNLGALLPPASNFGIYFGSQGDDWRSRYDEVYRVIKRHDIKCICSLDKAPFAISESLWMRSDILNHVVNFTHDDLAKLKYLWIYLAQDRGYYSGVVESEEYAALNEINQGIYLRELVNQVTEQYGGCRTFLDMKKYIFSGAIDRFCMKYKEIYIYGIGQMTRNYRQYICNVSGYIVSDGQNNPGEFNQQKVYFLSEIPVREDVGIVVCLDKKFQAQVIPALEQRGIKNYICI